MAERPEAMAAETAGVGLKMVDLNPGFDTDKADTSIAIGIKKGNPIRERLNQILSDVSKEDRLELMDEMKHPSKQRRKRR